MAVPVLNPEWRSRDAECRTLRGKLAVEKGRLSDLVLEARDMEPGPMVKALFNTAADLRPDPQRKELRILLHPLAEPRLNRMAEAVLVSLNEAEFKYPGTDLRMVYQMLTPANPPGG